MLVLVFASRDDATTDRPAAGPGQRTAARPPCPARAPGNVVLVHAPRDAAALAGLRADEPALVRAGQAVLLCPRGRPGRVQAFAGGRTITTGPRDAALHDFVDHWLGR